MFIDDIPSEMLSSEKRALLHSEPMSPILWSKQKSSIIMEILQFFIDLVGGPTVRKSLNLDGFKAGESNLIHFCY
jgi:hypothetical protein